MSCRCGPASSSSSVEKQRTKWLVYEWSRYHVFWRACHVFVQIFWVQIYDPDRRKALLTDFGGQSLYEIGESIVVLTAGLFLGLNIDSWILG